MVLSSLTRLARSFHLGTSLALFAAAGLQAASFVLLARGLGITGFGTLMVASAVTQLSGEMVSLGAGEALIRRVVRDSNEHGYALGHALIMTAVTVVPIGLGGVIAVRLLLPDQACATAVVFVTGELLGTRLIGLGEHMFMGHSEIPGANAVRIASAFARLVAVVGAVYVMQLRSVEDWLFVQGLTTLTAGVGCLLYAVRRFGLPRTRFCREDVFFGAMVAASHLSARGIQFGADRLVLGMMTSPAVVGVYSAATRGAQLATLPVQAVMRNLYASFFAVGNKGIDAARRFAMANLTTVVVIGVLAGSVMLAGADLLVLLLGREFADTAAIFRGLCMIPLTQGFRWLLGDAMSGAGHQGLRTTLELIAGVVFVLVLAGLASSFGAWGAVAAVYVYQLVVIGASGAALWLREKRDATIE